MDYLNNYLVKYLIKYLFNIYLIQILEENHIEGMLGMVASFPLSYDFFYLPIEGMG